MESSQPLDDGKHKFREDPGKEMYRPKEEPRDHCSTKWTKNL